LSVSDRSSSRPDKLGKYEIRGVLGRGAMGVVYDGWDPAIGRRVAIKTVRLLDHADPEAEEGLARFKREAQAAGRLTHPNIVGVYEYGEAESAAYIAMEFVEGHSLKERLDVGERFPVAETIRIMGQMLAALQFSHERGVIHRDIKPGNVMIAKNGQIKLADFGIARIESSVMTQDGTMLGTPAYMSPEQLMAQTVDARSDIYSSGVLLYQLLTGERPFDGGLTSIIHKALNTTPVRPSELSVTSPIGLDPVVARAMARRPDDRFATAQAFATALNEAFRAEPGTLASVGEQDDAEGTLISTDVTMLATTARPAPVPLSTPAVSSTATLAAREPPRRSSALLGGVAAAVLVMLGGGGAWFALNSSSHEPPAQVHAAGPDAPPTPPSQVVANDRPASPGPQPSASAPPAPAVPSASSPAITPGTSANPPAAVENSSPLPSSVPTPLSSAPSSPTTAATPAPPAAVALSASPAAPVTAPPPIVSLPQPPAKASAAPLMPLPPVQAPPTRQALLTPNLAAIRESLASLARSAKCAVPRFVLSDAGHIDVSGLVGAGPPEQALRDAVESEAQGASVGWNVTTFDGPYCDALDFIRPIAQPASPSLGLTLKDDVTRLKDNDPIRPILKLPEFPSHLIVDYLSHDGSVTHLLPADGHPDKTFAANATVPLGDPALGVGTVGPPFGTDMIVAVASSVPLSVQRRSGETDTVSSYMPMLESAMEGARRRNAKLAGRALVLDTVAK
jgi:eukaryotic-like serine/threonine-protein kinase